VKRKIIWLVVSCLTVVALVLASCGPAEVEEEEEVVVPEEEEAISPEEEEEVAPAPEKPRYGGVFTATSGEPRGFDDAYTVGWTTLTLNLTNEELLIGDWAKGSAGTGEHTGRNIFVLQFETTCLAESWEAPDAETLIFHIRKGVHWHDKPPVNGRELVAEDVAFSIRRIFENPESYMVSSYPGWFESATAVDKYTVVVKAKEEIQHTADVFANVADFCKVVPPEMVEMYGDMRDWRNSCGTGAFMLVDYVQGSAVTFERNPNYWGKDPLHPENTLPYLDGVKWLIIPDASTRISALRTAKIDSLGVGWEDAEDLMRTNPELQWIEQFGEAVWLIKMRTDKPELPFNDKRIRQALHMAIDLQEMTDTVYGGNAEILAWPVAPVLGYMDAYTPLEELPESTRELFEYQPDKARQLLAEAGYPDGFSTEIACPASAADLLSVIKAYWEDIGVDLEIKVKEAAIWYSIIVTMRHKELAYAYMGTGLPYKFLCLKSGSAHNLSFVDDPYINERHAQIWEWETWQDQPKRAGLLKEMTLHALDQAYAIQLPSAYSYNMWQPWVKNYHGEFSLGYMNVSNFPIWLWLDQDLKEEMTGRR